MSRCSELVESIENSGFAIVPQCLTEPQLRELSGLLSKAVESSVALKRGATSYAIRNVLDVIPELAGFQRWPQIRELVQPILGEAAFLVRAVFFDKSPDANWALFWHQDLSIPVRHRHDVDGFGPWTRKDGVDCVRPPMSVLQKVLTVRLHLDACTEENGALQVLPGSHLKSQLNDHQTHQVRESQTPTTCVLPAGGAVLMRPLLLHSSLKSTVARHRRVLHCEFAVEDLLAPLEWHRRETIA